MSPQETPWCLGQPAPSRTASFALKAAKAQPCMQAVFGEPGKDRAPLHTALGGQAQRKLEERHGVKVATWAGELADPATLEQAFEVVRHSFGGRLTAFVHNAGAAQFGSFKAS